MASNAAIKPPVPAVIPTLSSVSWLNHFSPLQATSFAIFASDVLALSCISILFILVRHYLTPRYHLTTGIEVLPFVALVLPVFLIQDLYPGLLIHPAEEMKKVFSSLTIAVFIWALVTFLAQTGSAYSRSVFLGIWVLGTPAILLFRYLTRSFFSNRPWWGVPTLVLGTGPSAQRVLRLLQNGRRGLSVKGVLSEGGVSHWSKDLPPIIGPLAMGPELSKNRIAQYAIVAMPQKSNTQLRHDVQEYCKGFSRVLLIPDMTGLCSLGIQTREVGGEIGFEFRQRLFSLGAALTKRMLDVFLCLIALITLLPIVIVVALLVKVTSRGPIFFGHLRYGLENRTFKAWKFRTMVPDAADILTDYLARHPEHRFEWERDQKLKHDPRVTWPGKWLRRLSLDELPQLFNVLVGHMSLVGPRPIVQSEIEKYGRGYTLYSRVRPGITGLWQVSGRNNTTYEERVSLDEYYVHNWSVWLDLYILIRTVKVLLTAEGAY